MTSQITKQTQWNLSIEFQLHDYYYYYYVPLITFYITVSLHYLSSTSSWEHISIIIIFCFFPSLFNFLSLFFCPLFALVLIYCCRIPVLVLSL
jgi:hypothetical protein